MFFHCDTLTFLASGYLSFMAMAWIYFISPPGYCFVFCLPLFSGMCFDIIWIFFPENHPLSS